MKMGTGTFTLGSTTVAPANSYTGGTVINSGILNLAGVGNSNVNYLLGDVAGGITLNGGQLKATSTNVIGARIVTVGSRVVRFSSTGTTTSLRPGYLPVPAR